MMRAQAVFPVAMGAAMGVMMPFMLHGMGAQSAVWFVLAHVAVVALVVLVLGTGLARIWPGLAARLRGHRPSLGHVGLMLGGAVVGFGGLHMVAELGGLH